MNIKSSAFEENQLIPSSYTCDGDNISPPIQFSGVSDNAQSFALIMDDPDAPGKTFTHWMVWNINPDTKEIKENEWPDDSEQGLNDGGKIGYTGPCPPSGTHHYHFKLYSLNKKLNLSPDIKKEELEREIQEILIEKSELVGIYKRKN